MLKRNRLLRRLAAASLATLFLLCSGCGSSPAPAEDTPAPSQAVTTPAPTAEQPPEPTAAASPTDVNAPAVRLPAPQISIERQVPEVLQFLTAVTSFTLTNAEGQTLTRSGTETSGTMEFTQQQLSAESGSDIFYAQIPYSTSFTCEPDASSSSGEWGFEIIGSGSTAYNWCHCVAKGSGKLESLEYDVGGRIIVRGEPGTNLELTLPMPDSALGENGWVRLSLTSAENEVCLVADGNDLSFSGLDADAAVSLDYGGFFSENGLTVELTSGSGSMDFGSTTDGKISVTPA